MIIEGISLTNDYIFKKIFTGDTEILRDFVSSILDENIVSLEVKNSELLPDFLENKASRLDILAETDKKEKINIEMQVEYGKDFDDRMAFYGMRLHTEQLKRGARYANINRTVLIDILNFIHPKLNDSDKFHTSFKLTSEDGVVLTNKFVIHYVELPKLKDVPFDEMTKVDKWISLLKNEGGKEMAAVLQQEPMIAKAMTLAQAIANDETERRIAQAREDAIMNWEWSLAASLEEGMEKGMEKGKEEGFKDGAHDKALSTAKYFLSKNIPIKIIAEGTGLTENELRSL